MSRTDIYITVHCLYNLILILIFLFCSIPPPPILLILKSFLMINHELSTPRQLYLFICPSALTLSPFSWQNKLKSKLFFAFFYKNTNRTGMLWNGQFWFWRIWVVVDLPDKTLVFKIWYMYILYTLYFYGSSEYKNTNLHYIKMVLTKKYSGHAEYF